METFTLCLYCPASSTCSSLFLIFRPPPLASSTALSLSQGFFQTSKFPQSSGGKLLRCHGLSEKALRGGRWECHTAKKGREKIRWKRRKTRRGTSGDILARLCVEAVPHIVSTMANSEFLHNQADCVCAVCAVCPLFTIWQQFITGGKRRVST